MDVSRGITSRQLCSTLTKAQNMGSARHSLGRRFVINGRLHLFQPLAVKILAVLHPFVVQVLVQPRHAFSNSKSQTLATRQRSAHASLAVVVEIGGKRQLSGEKKGSGTY
eukprot:3595367-Rhodomonas_salina.2